MRLKKLVRTSRRLASKTIIVAAISSRAYVKAAVKAGFEVIAIDAFADADTKRLARKTLQIDVQNGQFAHRQILDALNEIDLEACVGFSYGAGFEATAGLLDKIGKLIPVIGNMPETVRACKDPRRFFALCDVLEMAYPQTLFEMPSDVKNWLVKPIGESGGAHIRHLTPNTADAKDVYYQQIQAGMPMSCLFLANGRTARVIGYNAQWCSSFEGFPYRYGGAVSHADLNESSKEEVARFVSNATQNLGLRGINSFDFIWDEHRVFALEINPRLSATLDLYRTERGSLFGAHAMASLQGELQDLQVDDISRAHQIVYAMNEINIASKMVWPEWVCDIPRASSKIAAGMPVCTVTAEASTTTEAKRIVNERAKTCAVDLS